MWGFFFVLAGVLLFGFNLGVLPLAYKSVVFSWAMLLTLFGLIHGFVYRHYCFGLIATAVGIFWLAVKLGLPHPEFGKIIIPLALIVIGVKVLFRKKKSSDSCCYMNSSKEEELPEEGRIAETCVFSGSKRVLRSQLFKGGEVNCVFGGSEIDLSATQLAVGTTNIEINCVFGGATLIVPASWTVRHKVHAIFGGFVDRSSIPVDHKDPDRILLITGSCVFGGAELRYSET